MKCRVSDVTSEAKHCMFRLFASSAEYVFHSTVFNKMSLWGTFKLDQKQFMILLVFLFTSEPFESCYQTCI